MEGQPMYIGEYRHNLDSKNRLIMPVKFREGLGESFIVTKGNDGCLNVFSIEQYRRLMDRITAIPSTNASQRAVSRSLAGRAAPCSLDNQGRVQLTAAQKKAAKLEKAVVVVGNYDHIEIWDEETWERYLEAADEEFETASEALTDFMR